MKKYKYQILTLLLACTTMISGQENDIIVITKPNPSVSNLMNMVEIPVNTNTGVPNIDIPLVNLPTQSKLSNVNISLNYHSAGVAFTNSASDVGTGWNLIGDGVISRTISYLPDEYLLGVFEFLNWPINQIKFDDVYNYNFHGYSGKFRIVYNHSANSFFIEKLDINNLKITCEFVTGTHKIDSFTIYDENGLKYIFNVKDRNNLYYRDVVERYLLTQQISITEPTDVFNDKIYNYYSSYHLSEVYDNNNNKLINYTFTSHLKPGLVSFGLNDEVTNKLHKIESLNFGSILFNFQYNIVLENTLNDPFELREITVKNNNDITINEFKFSYFELTINKNRRHLFKVEKSNSNNQTNEKHEFEYNTAIINTSPYYCNNEDFYYGTDKFGYLNLIGNPFFTAEYDDYVTDGIFYEDFLERTSKDACLYGVLRTIKYPTGGKTEFEFESNTYRHFPSPYNLDETFEDIYFENNTDNHKYTEILNLNYNTSNSNQINFVVEGTTPAKIFIKLYPTAYYSHLNDPVDEPLYASFRLIGNGVDKILQRTTATCLGDFVELTPGSYSIIVTSLMPSNGQIIITKKELTTQTLKQWVYGGGLRIKKIAHFNSDTSNIPEKETNYNYQIFDRPDLSSGELFDGFFRSFATKRATAPQVNYKNIKITENHNKGYIKHTYDSYAESQFYRNSTNLNYFQNYFGYKNGMLKKIEYFDSAGRTLKSILNQIEHSESGTYMQLSSMLNYNFLGFAARPCWSKIISTIIEEYFYKNGTTETLKINQYFEYNPDNLKLKKSLNLNSSNQSIETNYSYAHEMNNQALIAKNMIGIPLKTESFKNGEKLSTQETIYKNWGNNLLAPEIIKTAKGNLALEDRIKYNVLDNTNGNPLEIEKISGIKIVYIWGYNNTQPIAKIENATYAQVQPFVANLQTLSNGNNELNLINALNNLRTSLPNTMITTYTYKPLIGISTVTDPKGDKQTYHYDSFNRLQYVKDAQGNILSENEYHYKN